MATFLFRLGRLGSLKHLQLENWGILKSCPAALFCTKTEKPTKPGKKTKTAAAEAPDERAILLAYKTAVAFPVRLSGPGRFPAQSLDGTGPAVVSTAESIVAAQVATPVTAASELVAAEPDPGPDPHVAKVVVQAATPIVASPSPTDEIPFEVHSKLSAPKDYSVASVATSSECGDAAAESDSDSTESDSDSNESDSDSDSEDEKAEMKKEIKSFPPEAEPQRITVTEVKAGTNEGQNEYGAPITSGVETAASLGAAQAPVKVASVGFEKLVKSGPEIITATEYTREVTGSDVSAKTASGVIKDAAFPVDSQVEAPGEAVGEAVTLKDVRSSSAEVAAVAGGDPAEAGTEDTLLAEAAAVAAAAPEASVHGGSTKERLDLAPIVTETAGEELQTEATAEHSKEAAAVPSEPEELLDNSTYKNYQHHSYTPYTFADLDLEMAKFRLPQPSSGKPSPRH